MHRLALAISTRKWLLSQPFIISRQTITEVSTLEIQLADRSFVGRGAAVGLDYAGETIASMHEQVQAVRPQIEAGVSRTGLIDLLPPGGARCAIDAALWDLEAKRDGVDPFAASDLAPGAVWSAITLGMRAPFEMEAAARKAASARWLKIKVNAHEPVAAVTAARKGAPSSRFIIDPNQAWSMDQLREWAPAMADLGVELLEQPIAVGAEDQLDDYRCPVPLCADEACGGIEDLDRIVGRFAAINIKLDKSGGLTAALQLADAAQARGLRLMVGCMLAPSLAIAPAMVLSQRCEFADLDAPPFLITDNEDGFHFEDGLVRVTRQPGLWG